MIKLSTLTAVLATLVLPSTASAQLRAPQPLGPPTGATFQQLPAIKWNAVRGAAEYEYEISAGSSFNSIPGSGPGKGTSKTHNLAAALDQAMPDGTYSWRVRALTKSGAAGAWSRRRTILKHWTGAPQIIGGDGASISWPNNPLVLSWSSVPYAAKYILTIATDPGLSNVVLGSAAQPQFTDGTSFVLPNTLADGAYYWAITPVDAEGHRGVRSRVGSFRWTWPTSTSTNLTDLNPGIFDPLFSWNPVPGAARYQVEINSSSTFAPGSKWCCTAATIGTSLAPPTVLANDSTYYWRVRALDANGNAGQWNYGGQFTKAFDSGKPSVPNVRVVAANGSPLAGTPATDTPIVTWDPVPGASRYEVQLGSYVSAGTWSYCDWSRVSLPPWHAYTATTAWTPLGSTGLTPGPSAWPRPQVDQSLPVNATYCFRVLARSDNDAQGQQVVSSWTYLNGADNSNQPAFTYLPPQSTIGSQPFNPNTPASAYITPLTGTVTPRTPLFTWNRLPGANGYFVVIARDQFFTDVADVGFTNVPAYAPRLANQAPLADQTNAYHWAVIPTVGANGAGSGGDVSDDNPQSFTKYSVPPTVLQPSDGSNVTTWPTFRWTPTENARTYTVQVSQDPSFGSLLDNVTTDGTAYTSSTTYPADTVLYWRVRANDWSAQGLNWSAVQTFTRRLPGSAPGAGNPTGGDGVSVLSWAPVAGAVGYNVHIDQGDGTSSDYTVDSTAFAPTQRHGLGAIDWQVRPLFPTSSVFGTVGGPFFAPQPYLLTLAPPTGATGVKTGSRVLISWSHDPAAKHYRIDVSTTDSFSMLIDSHEVDGTSWAPDINWNLPSTRGRLFWRVAAVDSWGTVGSYASGSFGKGRSTPKHRAKHKRGGKH
jgi:hypothetical protein